MRASLFAWFEVPLCWFPDMKNSLPCRTRCVGALNSQEKCPAAVSAQAKCFECAHHISRNKNSRPETSTTALTTFFGAHCLRFHQLNCLQLTLNNPQSRMPEISRRSHSFEQKKKGKYIEHGAEDFSGASLSEILLCLVRSGASLPHAKHSWEFDIFATILTTQKF